MTTDITSPPETTPPDTTPPDATETSSTGGEPSSRTGETKVVLVLREGLAANLAVNAAAVLGASIGATHDLPVGPDAEDASGTRYVGIVTTPVPVLAAAADELTSLFQTASAQTETTVPALTEVARQACTYGA